MTGFFDFENFSWGIIVGLFAVVVLLGVTFGLSATMGIEREMVPLYTLLAFTTSMALFEAGLIVYMHGTTSGTFHAEDRKNNLVLELNSIRSTRKDVEKGFMKREMDKESRDEMLRNLKQKELEIKNKLIALRKKDVDTEDGS